MLVHLLLHLARDKKKRVERTLGVAADLCCFCHTVRPFKIKRIGLVEQMSTGSGQTLDHVMECAVCGARFKTNPLAYEWLEPRTSHPRDIHALVQATYPELWQEYSTRLAFENRVLSAPEKMSPEERAAEMMELFSKIDPSVNNCFKQPLQFDKPSTAWLATGVAFSIALGIVSATALDQTRWSDPVCYAACGVFVTTLLMVLLLILTQRRRQLRNKLVPRLAWGLAPLHPHPAELEAVLAKCQSLHLLVGKKVELRHLIAAVEKTTVNTPPLTPPAQSKSPAGAAPGQSPERAQEILKVFQFFNPEIEHLYARSAHFDAPCILSGLGTLVTTGILVMLAIDHPMQQDALLDASVTTLVLGFDFTVYQAFRAPGRYVRKQAVPKLVGALRSLSPSETEIIRALKKCKMTGYMIGEKIKPMHLMTALKTIPHERIQ